MTVAVVGSVNMDVVARVARIPRPGETLLATGSSRGGGGKGANQAVAAARAGGVPAVFIGAVGADGDGSALREALIRDGIDVSGLATAPLPTGVALISVSDDGENAIVVVSGANAAVDRLGDDQRALVAAADVVLAQLEIPLPGVLAAAEARADHAAFVLNAAPSGALAARDTAARVLAVVDVLVVNEHELRDILRGTGGDAGHELEAAVDAIAARVPALVVTLGAAGAVVAVGRERRHVPAFPTQAVDTTAAGDTFCGVLAARLSDAGRRPDADVLADAARAGAAAAALAVARPGAQEAVPTADEVAGLLETAS
ncbi:PfkB family carbohydrate kinase [Microbacterium sp.]|uniref:PfkB family carbohydrate kinase n=1 Tax=Microbacterium sp. TaxID=51671 RepID=UPI002810CC8C|nr:PfkB family carbohydrate kinase [Microbacterium sp.]